MLDNSFFDTLPLFGVLNRHVYPMSFSPLLEHGPAGTGQGPARTGQGPGRVRTRKLSRHGPSTV